MAVWTLPPSMTTSRALAASLLVLALLPVARSARGDSACRGKEGAIASNAAYAEAGGPGLQYSVDYERHFACRVFARIGVSPFVPLPNANVTMAHLQIGALLGGESSNLELGLGASPVYSVRRSEDPLFHVVGTATVGYRYMPTESGVLFRVGFTPYFAARRLGHESAIRLILPWAGVSVGYVF